METPQRSVQGDPDRDLKQKKMETFKTFGKGIWNKTRIGVGESSGHANSRLQVAWCSCFLSFP